MPSAAAAAAMTSQNDCREPASFEARSALLGSLSPPKLSPEVEPGLTLMSPLLLILARSSPPLPAFLARHREGQPSVGAFAARGKGWASKGSATAVWRSHRKRSGSGGWILSAIFRMTYDSRCGKHTRRAGPRIRVADRCLSPPPASVCRVLEKTVASSLRT